MRKSKTTTKWEQEFLFHIWEATTMRIMEKDPRDYVYVANILFDETGLALKAFLKESQPNKAT